MATPLTAQIGRPERVDLGAALIGGMQNYQSMQGQKLQNQAMQQDVSQGDFAMNLRNLQIMNSLAKKAKTIPLEQRPMFRDQQMQLMQSIGINPSQMAQAPLDDASLDQWIGQSDAVLASVMPRNQAQQQFGAQETLKDENGNLFFATSRRDPSTGQVVGAVAAVDGSNTKPVGQLSVAGGYGLTATERVEQLAAESGAKKQAEQNVIRDTQPGIESAITDARTTAKLEAERAIKQQGQMTKLADADRLYNSLSGADLDLIYGRGEEWYPAFFRSQKGIDLMAQRDQLVGMLNLAARGQLAGQGTVSDTEAKSILQAATTLASPNISPQEARVALDAAMNSIYKSAGQNFNPEQTTQPAQPSIDDLVNQYAD